MTSELVTIGEVCTFQRGLTYSKSDEVEKSKNIVLRANNIDLAAHTLDLNGLKYISETFEVPASKTIRKGCVLICTASGSKSHLGKVAFVDVDLDAAFGGFMAQIAPTERVDGKYLYYALTSPLYDEFIRTLSSGVNINNLKFDDLKRFSFRCPTLTEQRRIVAVLDEMFELIATVTANAEKNLANARDIFDSYLNSIFNLGDAKIPGRKLRDVCLEITVGHVGPMAREYKGSGIPFLRSQNIRPFEISLENVIFIDEAFHSALKKSTLLPGDLAIVRTGYPGTAAVIPSSLSEANCSDLVIIRPGPEVDANYLAAFFNSTFGRTLVGGQLVGSAQKHFNVTAAKEVMLYLPSIGEQRTLAARISEWRHKSAALEAAYRVRIDMLTALKASMLAKAFSGKLSQSCLNAIGEAAE